LLRSTPFLSKKAPSLN